MQEAVNPTEDSAQHFRRNILPWIMFSICALYYCYAYFLRVSPNMMKDELIKHFSISAAAFGNLAAFYYYAYTPMQIPVGVIVDTYGARITLMMACLLATMGVVVFISADEQLWMAMLGRFMMGMGSAFAYISVLKISSVWLPSRHFALAAGMTTAFGMIAAVISDFYLAKYIETVGYEDALYAAIVIGIFLAMFIFLFLRNRPRPEHAHQEEPEGTTYTELAHGLKVIVTNPQTWYIGMVGFFLYLPASVFMDLWGVPFLQDVYHLNKEQAALLNAMPFFGWIIGGPATGWLSDKIGLRRLPLLAASIVAAVVSALIFYIPNLNTSILGGLLFLLGLICGTHPLVFSLSRENSSNRLAGTSTATTNFLIMLGGVIFQPVVGLLLTWHANGVANGVKVYSHADYMFALSVIPIGLVISAFLTLLIKETYCHVPEE